MSNQYTLRDSFEFCELIRGFQGPYSYMASFDVTSLFTNIPLDETISIICEHIEEEVLDRLNILRNDLAVLLQHAVKDNLFLFDENLYTQIDGVAMGSPLGPTFANAFLCHHETRWLDDCPLAFKPTLYRRYVDDTFLLFRKKEHAALFLSYLNQKHPNIAFTMEGEVDGRLPFLDVNVSRSTIGFSTDVYRKPTFTGLGMKFASFIPTLYKHNVVSCLIERAHKICSSVTSVKNQVAFLRHYFMTNGFPLHFFNEILDAFVKKSSRVPILGAVGRPVYLKIPFMGPDSYDLKKEIQKLVKRHYPQVSLRVILHNGNTVARLFPFKDRTPEPLRSSLVYKYCCGMCNAVYIGQTARHFEARISEHKGVSFRNGSTSEKPSFSSIRQHARDADHPIVRSNFSVLASAKYNTDLESMEKLLIKFHNPSLNIQH